MARGGRVAAPVCFLLLTFLPICGSQTGRQGHPNQDRPALALSKKNLKDLLKLLDQRIKVLHQRRLTLEHDLPKNPNRLETVNGKELKEYFIKEKTTPSSLTAQERPFPNSYPVLVDNKLQNIFSNIDMNTPEKPNEVEGVETEEDKNGRTLLSDQDKNAGNFDGRSIKTTNITLRFHSTDNSSTTLIDIYNLNDSIETPEVHIVVSNIMTQGIKSDSVIFKDNGLQVIVNSSVDKEVTHIPEKRRKTLIKLDRDMAARALQRTVREIFL
ncbi:uncharacterized protein LOC128351246 [Hemicordylus capensis]|uniref:uncharacterized protein LOC128351246 n=1 Tax=Hemicordylus capensis TaxID=884348 RepID=UPI002302D3DA|nr:uncharacterized protein LOC128351246 [Hemicordylus capensis]XP_053166604.1 uncharacterized protein LOC128351246 [Hemicordylus capensis]